MQIRDVLAYLGVPYWEAGHRHVTSGHVGINCPQCSPDSGKAKLGINVTSLYCRCWTCGPTRLGQALADITGRRVGEILSLLPGRESFDFAPKETATGKYTPPDAVRDMLPIHRDYLAGRGIDPDRAAAVWGVKGIGHDGGRYKWRLFLPASSNRKPASWTTRAVGDSARRYDSAPAACERVPIKSLLYGEEHARHAVICVEGPLTAVWGGPGYVATCGVDFTPAQVAKLARFPVRAVCYDREPAAQAAARKLADALRPFGGETFVVTTSQKSIDESPAEEAIEIRKRFLE